MAKAYHTYAEAAQDYVAQFGTLLEAPAGGVSAGVTRGAGDVPADLLIERADAIADISGRMVELAAPSWASPDVAQREGLSVHFVAQAAAELQLAAELLHIAAAPQTPGGELRTRSDRTADLGQAIRALQATMAIPLTEVSTRAVAEVRAKASKAQQRDDAKAALKKSADQALVTISQRVRELGGDIAFDLVMQTKWTAVLDGALLLRGDVKAKLDQVKQGAGALVDRAVGAAEKTVLNVYDKIMALLGKDAEDAARKQVKTWLEKIEKDKKIDLFTTLVDELYRMKAFKTDLDAWTALTGASLDKLNETTEAVGALEKKFITLAGQAAMLSTAIGLAKLLSMPQVLLVVAGLQVALLTVVVYAGYDYIGYKQVNFMDITKGVAQVIKENLQIKDLPAAATKT